MKRQGICVAGNMVVDILYPVSGLPGPGELTTITGARSRSTGGALCNVIMDLARLDPTLRLTALGRLGDDPEGDLVMERLSVYPNINVANIIREGNTTFTLVMADEITKQRSFFIYRGASADFSEGDIDWAAIDAGFLHIGYILLLDALDREDGEYGTKMARLLHSAKQHGIKTSIDVVSEKGNRYARLVPPALKYTDYCIINEIEAEKTTGVLLRRNDGVLLPDNMPAVLTKLFEMGVSTWAVVHCVEGGYGMDAAGNYVAVNSLTLDDTFIKGSVGAGDAFCAGALLAGYEGQPLKDGIALGIAAAACSLSESDATSGMKTKQDALALYTQLRSR
ncbi:MAG: carbohydrate kinase family protein [Clostridiales bacterium]|nr:carbohydrate kinase family protein [Clostridiales bacterium]